MAKTKTTIASGPAPKTVKKKTVRKKIEEAVVDPVVELVEDIKDDLNEPVETFTIRKSWLIVAAIVLTVAAIAFIL